MIERGMSVEDLDHDLQETKPQYCWEYHGKRMRRHTGGQDTCLDCVVRQSMALRCYELRKHVDHRRVYCETECSGCGYYRKYASPTA